MRLLRIATLTTSLLLTGCEAVEPWLPGGDGCTDTCTDAMDGACDDGGEDSDYALCALGTDCSDCGARGGDGEGGSGSSRGGGSSAGGGSSGGGAPTCTNKSLCLAIVGDGVGEHCNSDTSFRVTVQNTCAERIYACIKINRHGGGENAGCSHLSPGQSWDWYDCDSPGTYAYAAVEEGQLVAECFSGW